MVRRRPLTPLLLARPSRFAGIAQGKARLFLAVLALLLAGLAALGSEPDINTFAEAMVAAAPQEAAIDAVRAGADYYTAAPEAVKGGEPSWLLVAVPPPTLTVVAANLPRSVLRCLFWVLAAAVAIAWYVRLAPVLANRATRVIATLLVAGGVAPMLMADIMAVHAAWAGLLIALSLAVRRPGRLVEAIAIGLAAALIAPAALFYLVLMALLALYEDARGEAAGWLAAIGLCAVVLGLHAHALTGLSGPIDTLPFRDGAAGLVSALSALAAASVVAPLPFAPALAALAVAGWAAWRNPVVVRTGATIATGVVLAAVSARSDLALLVAPLSLAGLIFAPDALRDLAAAALDRRRITVTRVLR